MRYHFVYQMFWVVVFSSLYSLAWGVDINLASAQQLTELKGVGAKTAERILEERRRGGPFLSPEDLSVRVKGMGKKKIEKLQAQGLQIGEDSKVSPVVEKGAQKVFRKSLTSETTSSVTPGRMVERREASTIAHGQVFYVRPKQAREESKQ